MLPGSVARLLRLLEDIRALLTWHLHVAVDPNTKDDALQWLAGHRSWLDGHLDHQGRCTTKWVHDQATNGVRGVRVRR